MSMNLRVNCGDSESSGWSSAEAREEGAVRAFEKSRGLRLVERAPKVIPIGCAQDRAERLVGRPAEVTVPLLQPQQHTGLGGNFREHTATRGADEPEYRHAQPLPAGLVPGQSPYRGTR